MDSGDHSEPAPQPEVNLPPIETLEAVQIAHVKKVVARLGGNISRAAIALGIDRRTLYRYIERHRIERPAAQTGRPVASVGETSE